MGGLDPGARWSPDGEDLTVPPGTLAKAAWQGVRAGTCDREHCKSYRSGQTYRHAAGFRHAYKPPGPKPRSKLSRAYEADASRRRTKRKAHAKALAAKPDGWLSGPGEGMRRQVTPTGSKLLVLSAAPWAWTTDRTGNPVPLEA